MIKGFSIQPDGDIVFVTVSKYYMFWKKYGTKGMDALHLYLHLIFTARLQHTNIVKADREYLKKGLYWGRERLDSARNLLLELELIEQIERKGKDGRFEGYFIKVKTTTRQFEYKDLESINNNSVTDGLETGGLETGCRSEPTNALTSNINALTNNKRKKKEHPTLEEIKAYVREKNYNINCDAFYKYYSSNDWKDSNGKQVKSWKHKLLIWHNPVPATNDFKDYE